MYHFSSRNFSREAVKAIKHLNPQVHRECHSSDITPRQKKKIVGERSSPILQAPSPPSRLSLHFTAADDFQHSPTHRPCVSYLPDGKLVPSHSAPWFFQWQHLVHALPATTQKLEFNHLSLNHLISIYCSRHPALPSALSKMPALGKTHRLFLRYHAVILLHILSLLKSSFLPHGPEKNKGRKEGKRLRRGGSVNF